MMMVNGRIEIARTGGVRATVAVPLVLTPPVGALLRVGQNLKTRKTKASRSYHVPPPSPSVWREVAGETAFQKREPSHHTPMQGVRRPLGEKQRDRTPDQNPASVPLDLLTRGAPVLGRMEAAAQFQPRVQKGQTPTQTPSMGRGVRIPTLQKDKLKRGRDWKPRS